MREEDLLDPKTIERLTRFIQLRTKTVEDAEEILQETLISSHESLPSFKGKSSFFVWLCGIAKHEIADYYRKQKIKTFLFSRLPFLEELADQALGPEEELIETELKVRVKEAMFLLTEGYRRILRLKYIEEKTVAQIAQKLGISVKAAESRLTRARVAFREVWVYQNEQKEKIVRNRKEFHF